MTSGRGIPGSQEVVAEGGSAPTRLGWPGRRVAGQPAQPAGGNHRRSHTQAPLAARPLPLPPPPLTVDPAPAPHPPLPSQPAPPSLPQLTPTHPDPQRRARPSVADHQTGSSGVQHGDSAPAPSALLTGSGRPLTRRARARAPAKNSQARLYLVRPDPGAAARTAPHPAPPGAPSPAPPRAARRGAEWRRGGGDRGGAYSAICSARQRRGRANRRI